MGFLSKMLSFLLDEHISPTIAHQINRKRPEIIIFPLISWQEGQYLGLDDDIVLTAATDAHLTFVTYDQNTIPPLLCAWGDAQKCHCGVILAWFKIGCFWVTVHEKTSHHSYDDLDLTMMTMAKLVGSE